MPYLAKNTVIDHRHALMVCPVTVGENGRLWRAVRSAWILALIITCKIVVLQSYSKNRGWWWQQKRQRDLEVTRQNIQQTIWIKEKAMGVLQQEVKNINNSADEAVEGSKENFGQLFHRLEQVFPDIKRQVRSTQKENSKWVRSKSLWGGRSRRSLSWGEGLLHSTATSFLMNSHCQFREFTDSDSIKVRPLSYFKNSGGS